MCCLTQFLPFRSCRMLQTSSNAEETLVKKLTNRVKEKDRALQVDTLLMYLFGFPFANATTSRVCECMLACRYETTWLCQTEHSRQIEGFVHRWLKN